MIEIGRKRVRTCIACESHPSKRHASEVEMAKRQNNLEAADIIRNELECKHGWAEDGSVDHEAARCGQPGACRLWSPVLKKGMDGVLRLIEPGGALHLASLHHRPGQRQNVRERLIRSTLYARMVVG